MILYRPIDSDVQMTKIKYRPKSCFVMTKLGKMVPNNIKKIREELSEILTQRGIDEIDAESIVTGRDFLMKIWNIIVAVPLGIAIIDENLKIKTLENIFFEIGVMKAYGKETIIIKMPKAKVPSDLLRDEYVEYSDNFRDKINKFLDSFFELPEHFLMVSEILENNPLLAIDYLRRAYLITGDKSYREKALEIFDEASIQGRAKNSVEMLLTNF